MLQVVEDCFDEPRFRLLAKSFEKAGSADRCLGRLGWGNDARRRLRSAVNFKKEPNWARFLEGVRRPSEATLVFDQNALPAIPGLYLANANLLAGEEASCSSLPFFCRDMAFMSYPEGPNDGGVLVTTFDAGGGCRHDLLDEHGMSRFRHERHDPSIERVWEVKTLDDRNMWDFWGSSTLPGYQLVRDEFTMRVLFNSRTVDTRFTLKNNIFVVSKHVACRDEDNVPVFYRIVGIHQIHSEPNDVSPHGMADHIFMYFREDLNPNHQHNTSSCNIGTLTFVRAVIADAPVGLELRLNYDITCKLDVWLNDRNAEPIVQCNNAYDALRMFRRHRPAGPLFKADVLGQAYQVLIEQYESLVAGETSIALSDIANWKLATQPPDTLLSLLATAQRYAKI